MAVRGRRGRVVGVRVRRLDEFVVEDECERRRKNMLFAERVIREFFGK